MSTTDHSRLDAVVANAHKEREKREQGYRERALKMYPWVCGRCTREFTLANRSELTVHHRDHNHDNNPADGSNWELLCVYCHDNEHTRHEDHLRSQGLSVVEEKAPESATHNPFADLKAMLEKGK